MISIADDLQVNRRMFLAAKNDVMRSAAAARLTYVTDGEPGYLRMRRGKGFFYMDGEQKLRDTSELKRIKALVIPPAWENVWICKKENGHLQATGYDKLGRKQYQYHPRWNSLRNQTKFHKLLDFGKQLPAIRAQLQKDLALPSYPQEKVLAAVVSLLDRTNIRVGNDIYEKLYGSFGLTTMKNRHVNIRGTQICFAFKGKKGIRHIVTLRSKKLARIIKGCRDIPGKELFEYYDPEGNVRCVDSGMVNQYIQNIASAEVTAKDFRTWTGTLQGLLAFKELGGFENETERKQKINTALDMVAEQLGNTRAVCKKYYLHPIIVELYEQNKLEPYISGLKVAGIGDELSGLSREEKTLLTLLEDHA